MNDLRENIMTNKQTWEKACERMGLAYHARIAGKLHYLFPSIGDRATTLAMMEWLGKQNYGFSVHSATSDTGERGWSVLIADKYLGCLTLHDALAAAVCALPIIE